MKKLCEKRFNKKSDRMKRQKINHHSAGIIPYHKDTSGNIRIMFEVKDKNYFPPFFNNGLNLIGGNRQYGLNYEINPFEVLKRELKEEFLIQKEKRDFTGNMLGKRSKTSTQKTPTFSEHHLNISKSIANILLEKINHFQDFQIKVEPPVVKEEIIFLNSTFYKKLSSQEFDYIQDCLQKFNYQITTDNIKYGSHLMLYPLKDIKKYNYKFARGYNYIINSFLQNSFRENLGKNLEFSSHINVSQLKTNKCCSFQEFRKKGYNYRKI